ncbi:MAG: CDP-alcohol phosphatidyltransferase family protein [Nitrospira sp.]|nr:CDP-alcohol phosphatidyltransferase family protein [bacterium]MBL7049642.1 CDP-alcohol phosphatidyltransferase family protein [Nitrospira sp.]
MPFFAASIIYGEYQYSLMLYVIASITDLLDGFIARISKQITYFGSILDPVADKFFLLTSFILMSSYGLLPKWLTIVVLSKDLIVITGIIILYFVTDKLKIDSTFLGKVTTAMQFILIGLILLLHNLKTPMPYENLTYGSIALLTAISGLHYVYIGLKVANSIKANTTDSQ